MLIFVPLPQNRSVMTNPFFITGIIPDPYFCDREKETQQLVRIIETTNHWCGPSYQPRGCKPCLRPVWGAHLLCPSYPSQCLCQCESNEADRRGRHQERLGWIIGSTRTFFLKHLEQTQLQAKRDPRCHCQRRKSQQRDLGGFCQEARSQVGKFGSICPLKSTTIHAFNEIVRHVSTRGMAPGVYVLRLINGEDVKTQKIVIR